MLAKRFKPRKRSNRPRRYACLLDGRKQNSSPAHRRCLCPVPKRRFRSSSHRARNHPPRYLFWLRPSHLPPRLKPSHPSQPHHARSMKSRPPNRDAGVSRSRLRPGSKPLGRPRNVCANRATAPRSARSFGRAGCGIGSGSVPLVKSWRPRRRSRVSDTRKPLPRPTPFCTESNL